MSLQFFYELKVSLEDESKRQKEETNMSHMSTSLVTVDCFFSVHESPVYNRMSEISY